MVRCKEVLRLRITTPRPGTPPFPNICLGDPPLEQGLRAPRLCTGKSIPWKSVSVMHHCTAHHAQIQCTHNPRTRAWSTTDGANDAWDTAEAVCTSGQSCIGAQSKLGNEHVLACKHCREGESRLEKKFIDFTALSKCWQKGKPWKKDCKIPVSHHPTRSHEKVTTWYMSKADPVLPQISVMFNKYTVTSLNFTIHDPQLIFGLH